MGRPRSCTCGECKKCKKTEYMRRYYAERPELLERARERGRQKWRDEPERMRAKDRERYRRGKAKSKRDPIKAAAHSLLNHALRKGTIEREPCLFCGGERVEGHHHDYTKPLEVTWLCRRHHRLVHRSF
jgi:hypothetical protein